VSDQVFRPRSATEIVDGTFRLYREHFVSFLTLSTLLYLPVIALMIPLLRMMEDTSADPAAFGAVVLPLVLASLAAYGFAWIDFRGRAALFVGVFALQIVPLQVALIPLLTDYVDFGLSGTFWPIWISHSIFALPLAVYLLNNFMREIPRELVEAARVDGAGHVKIFFQVLMPLLTPAIAAFGIFQFLWVWNDLLVGLTFGSTDTKPITVVVAELVGTRGSAWHLLSAGAFVSIILPVIVFVSLQRYFVRGLLAGGLKG